VTTTRMSKIPLKTRKSIKTALEKGDAAIKKASAAFGKELTFVDNTSDLFEALKAANKSEDWLFGLGDYIVPYIEQFTKVMCDFCKNADNKEQLEAELITAKFGVRLDPRTGEDASSGDRYWVVDEGVLWVETKPDWFGSYLSYYDEDRLSKILGGADSMSLNTRKSLRAAQVEIDKCMQKASKCFGAELTWVDNYQTLHDAWKASGKSQDYLNDLGTTIKAYPAQLVTTFEEFCKDADNKEALQEVLTTGKVGVRFAEQADTYWVIEDGTLWMETQPSYFGSYLSYYDKDRLERKL